MCMIVSIVHKGLKLLWYRNDSSKLPFDQVRKIREILYSLDTAKSITDLDLPGFRLHPLKGVLSNYWSISVRSNWRVIFKFENGEAHLIDYLDYH